MADRFLPFTELLAAVGDRTFERPPAIVCNAHITGLGVARALSAHEVPVIAIDKNGDGVAPNSEAVDLAGQVSYPLDDEAGFEADVEALVDELDGAAVAFACMDEWVHAFARTRPDGVRLPFAADRIDAVLDKESLYGTAEALGVPYPETYRIRETAANGGTVEYAPEAMTADEAADALGFPLVIKPALKREFEAAIGTNVIEVEDADEYAEIIDAARRHQISIMAQERVPVIPGEDRSYVSYVPAEGDPLGVVGNPARHPMVYGTSCLVQQRPDPTVERRARSILEETGYHGISEAEFVYDGDRDEYVLLDVNTRPWKWISLPVEAGANLPYAAYADAVGAEYQAEPLSDATWVYLRDYLALLSDGGADWLTAAQWRSLISGDFEGERGLTTGVYSPADPGPMQQLLATEIGGGEYYCAC